MKRHLFRWISLKLSPIFSFFYMFPVTFIHAQKGIWGFRKILYNLYQQPQRKVEGIKEKARKILSTTCWLISYSINSSATPLSVESIEKRIFKIYSKLHFPEEGKEGDVKQFKQDFFHTVFILKIIYINKSLNFF